MGDVACLTASEIWEYAVVVVYRLRLLAVLFEVFYNKESRAGKDGEGVSYALEQLSRESNISRLSRKWLKEC